MHIPDGFLDLRTSAAAAALAVMGVSFALRETRLKLPARKVPLIGLVAAFVFAAQMLNFPVAAGTSGHLLGAVLACVLVGPAAAVVAMTAVVVLQCLMFADGGVTALGANVLNMALIAPAVGCLVFGGLRRLLGDGGGLRNDLLAAGFAAWCATVAASIACAVQLALSGTARLAVIVPAMGGVHMIIGIGEALITMLVLAVVARARPDLFAAVPSAETRGSGRLVRGGLAVALLLAVGIAPFASSLPDGLEKVAEQLGFAGRAGEAHAVPLPDYAVSLLQGDFPVLAVAAAGAVGTLAAFAIAWFVARALAPPGYGR